MAIKFQVSTIVPRSIFLVFDLMEEPSISTADGSLQFKRRWLLSLWKVAVILISGSDINNSLFAFFNYVYCSVFHTTCNI